MSSKRDAKTGKVIMQKPIKKFATDKQVKKATDFAMTKYAEAIKKLADR